MHDVREDVTNFCDFAVVKVHHPVGLILFILNIVLPGIGTIVSSFLDKRRLNGLALLFGILQFLFCLSIVPWIWSIWHGYMIYEKSR